MGDERGGLIRKVARMVPVPAHGRSVRVGVDGVDGSGKSTFAGELVVALRDLGRTVVHICADGFHNLREVRYRRGRDSAEGFWLDSYDYRSLADSVLDPFGPGGSRRYWEAIHDVATDQILDPPWLVAPAETVLVVDGLFLHRDELVGAWDFSVFLDVPFEVSVARMAERDGSHPDPTDPSVARYVGGQRLYFAACAPQARATVVIDNTDLARPVLRA